MSSQTETVVLARSITITEHNDAQMLERIRSVDNNHIALTRVHDVFFHSLAHL